MPTERERGRNRKKEKKREREALSTGRKKISFVLWAISKWTNDLPKLASFWPKLVINDKRQGSGEKWERKKRGRKGTGDRDKANFPRQTLSWEMRQFPQNSEL